MFIRYKEALNDEEIECQELCLHMKLLKNEISILVEKMQQQEQAKKDSIKNEILSESVALMKSLLLLIT